MKAGRRVRGWLHEKPRDWALITIQDRVADEPQDQAWDQGWERSWDLLHAQVKSHVWLEAGR